MRTGPLGKAMTCAGKLIPLKASHVAFRGKTVGPAKAVPEVHKAKKTMSTGVKVFRMWCLLMMLNA
jgi:hypothetical protein